MQITRTLQTSARDQATKSTRTVWDVRGNRTARRLQVMPRYRHPVFDMDNTMLRESFNYLFVMLLIKSLYSKYYLQQGESRACHRVLQLAASVVVGEISIIRESIHSRFTDINGLFLPGPTVKQDWLDLIPNRKLGIPFYFNKFYTRLAFSSPAD